MAERLEPLACHIFRPGSPPGVPHIGQIEDDLDYLDRLDLTLPLDQL